MAEMGIKSVPKRYGLNAVTIITIRNNIIVQAVIVAITVGYRYCISFLLSSAIADVTAVDDTIPPIAPENIIPLLAP